MSGVGKFVLVGLVAGSMVGLWAAHRQSRKAQAANAPDAAASDRLAPGEVVSHADQAANAASLAPRSTLFDYAVESGSREYAAQRQAQRWMQAIAEGGVYVPGVHTLER